MLTSGLYDSSSLKMILGLTDTLVIIVPTLFALYLLRKYFLSDHTNNTSELGSLWDVKDVHGWVQNRLLSQHCKEPLLEKPSYCNTCKTLILSGGFVCEVCGAVSDGGQCMKEADLRLRCKKRAVASESLTHHWMKGNLEVPAFCEVCREECGTETGLVDFQCAWCLSCVHTSCIDGFEKVCDLGRLRNLIVPPNCVITKGIRRNYVEGIKKPSWEDEWKPVLVFANAESGGSDAAAILSRSRRLLNPLQCLDIKQVPPKVAIDQWCKLLHPAVPRILVAGGDGSVSWILSEIEELKLEDAPAVGILPLGTGNDLSRVLNWGEGPEDEDLLDKLLEVYKAKEDVIDRWQVVLQPFRHLGLRMPSKSVRFTNYFSIGVDALITLNFHSARESSMYPFRSRILNKLIYLTFGTKDVLEHSCEGLDRKVTLYLDGAEIPLTDLESIVFLNIDSWGGGAKPWKLGEFEATSYNDGLIEVFGVSSSFHIAQMQVGLSAPVRLGQATSAKYDVQNIYGCPHNAKFYYDAENLNLNKKAAFQRSVISSRKMAHCIFCKLFLSS